MYYLFSFLILLLDFKLCSVIEDGCEVRYHVNRLVTGDEDMIMVYFDRNQSDAKTLRSNPGTVTMAILEFLL